MWIGLLLLAGAYVVLTLPLSATGQTGGKEDEKKKEGDKKDKKGFDKKDFDKKGFGKGGKGFGGPGGEIRKIVKDFDKDGDGILNAEERKAAREFAKKGGGGGKGKGKGGMGKGGMGKGKGGNQAPPKPGPRISIDDVKSYPKAGLYEPTVLRTLFLEFEDKDWEEQLADFYHTDVEVPATLWVDGKKYPNVGVRFRGASSYFRYGMGSKRSLNLTMDFVDKKQKLYGYHTLNLLNGADDPSYLHTVLYSEIARTYIPAPKANLVKVAINGESWGLYTSVQQFNKEFTKEFFKSDKGARWKVQGSPGGTGGLDYIGDNIADYKRRYRIKSKDEEKSWKALVNLCKVLTETPLDKLEEALKPILDIEGALWFLALDVALINMDGYWVRASDYTIYLDPKGKFHLVPHDMNESMMAGGGGPGGRGGPGGGPGGGGARSPMGLDPLVGLTDARKPLRSRLLAVPALKKRYLEMVRSIAEDKLDWKKLGPIVGQYRAMIEEEVEIDTRKGYSLEAFKNAVAEAAAATEDGPGRRSPSLRTFAEQRRKYLLEYPEIAKLERK
jgi:spore coat protein CotH